MAIVSVYSKTSASYCNCEYRKRPSYIFYLTVFCDCVVTETWIRDTQFFQIDILKTSMILSVSVSRHKTFIYTIANNKHLFSYGFFYGFQEHKLTRTEMGLLDVCANERFYHSNKFGSYWEYLLILQIGYFVDHCSFFLSLSLYHTRTDHSYIYL